MYTFIIENGKKGFNMDLTKGLITKQLICFSIPIIFTLIASMALSIADQIIVANCLGQNALATISSINGIVGLAYILLNGFSNAFTVIASKAFKDDDPLEKNRVFVYAMILSAISALVFIVIFVCLSSWWIHMLHVPNEISQQSAYCLRIYGFSFVFMMLNNMFSSLFNGFNNSKTPMLIQVSMNILNIVLDFVFLQLFHLQVEYAVYASLISSFIGAVVMSIVFHHRYPMNTHISFEWHYFKRIFSLSLSMMFQQSIMNICGMLMSMKVNTFGVPLINLNMACENIQNLFILIFIGSTNAFAVFLGTNYAAKCYQRMLDGVKSMLIIGSVLFIIVSIVCLFTYPYLLKLYIQELDVFGIQYSQCYMLAMIVSLLGFYIKYTIDGFMKTYENMKEFIISSSLNLCGRMIVFYLFVNRLGLYALPLALIVSIYLSMFYNLYFYFRIYKPMLKSSLTKL